MDLFERAYFVQIELKPPTSQLLAWDEQVGVQFFQKNPHGLGDFLIFCQIFFC